MSYATTGALVLMWNACPRPVSWIDVSSDTATPTLSGHGTWPLSAWLKNRIATSPGGIFPFGSGAYLMPIPVPDGMRANDETSNDCPSRCTLTSSSDIHVLAMYAAKQEPVLFS